MPVATTVGSQLNYAGSDLQIASHADTHDTLGVVAGTRFNRVRLH